VHFEVIVTGEILHVSGWHLQHSGLAFDAPFQEENSSAAVTHQSRRGNAACCVSSADEGLAKHFGAFYDAKKIYVRYDEMLADPESKPLLSAFPTPSMFPPR